MASKARYDSSKARYDSKEVVHTYTSYAQVYPDELFQKILSFHGRQQNSKSLALDVACGSGISTSLLAPHFDKVIGVDPSVFLLERADRSFANVSYREGKAEDLSFQADNSVDLLLIGTAMHLTDIPTFYKEVARVLKPGGTFAVAAYFSPNFPYPEADAAQDEFIARLSDRFFTKRQKELIQTSFRNEILPFPGQIREEVRTKSKSWSVSRLMSYLTIISFYQDLMKEDPASTELTDLQAKITAIYNKENPNDQSEDPTMEMTWDFFALLASKPKQ